MTDRPTAAKAIGADLLASFVVFMVALPLCIGIAQACGLPPEAGVVTGVVGGILVGLIAGSPLQVSGPAAGLIVLVVQFLDDAHRAGHTGTAAVALLGLAILIAGGLQVLAGLFRIGQWFRAVSPAVVEGMLAGIGITIFAKQFHEMVDDTAPKAVLDALATIPQAIWKGIVPPADARADHAAAALIGLLTILVLVGWKALIPKKWAFVPAAVVAIALSILVVELAGLGVERVQISSNLMDGLTPIRWEGWGVLGSGLVWKAAVTFAIIASAETLLCAAATDTMHSGPRTKYDRELIAQGVGNLVCGALGALPMTGVIVRSSANVEAGAKTRLSAVLHGVWLLAFVALLPGVLSRIPGSALAAVLVYTGWKLLNFPGLYRLAKQSRSEALIFVATAVAIVVGDLLMGVVLGIVLSAIKLLYLFSHLEIVRQDTPAEQRVDLHLEGAGTFLRLPKLAAALDAIPPGVTLHIHLDRLRLVDHAVMTLLTTFRKQFEAQGGTLSLDWEQLQSQFYDPKLARREAAVPCEQTKLPRVIEQANRTKPMSM